VGDGETIGGDASEETGATIGLTCGITAMVPYKTTKPELTIRVDERPQKILCIK
jgi:hypothetical protein